MPFALPPALSPGDWVAVVAPASPFDTDEFWRGMAWIRDRYRIRAGHGLFERTGYLAGDDARRSHELARAMVDPEVKAVVAARGGYGAMRLLDALPWDAFVRAPKWLVGFSDVTALHVEATARGIASIHGPNATGLAEVGTRGAWLAALERPTAKRVWTGLRIVHAGSASGPIVGGNLALVEAMAASGRLRFPAGAIVALEDVSERPYRLDRMLTALRLGGHLRGIGGIVLGSFARCDAGADGVQAEEVLAERTAGLGIPVVAGAPFGHGERNEAFVLGGGARVEGGTVTLGG